MELRQITSVQEARNGSSDGCDLQRCRYMCGRQLVTLRNGAGRTPQGCGPNMTQSRSRLRVASILVCVSPQLFCSPLIVGFQSTPNREVGNFVNQTAV